MNTFDRHCSCHEMILCWSNVLREWIKITDPQQNSFVDNQIDQEISDNSNFQLKQNSCSIRTVSSIIGRKLACLIIELRDWEKKQQQLWTTDASEHICSAHIITDMSDKTHFIFAIIYNDQRLTIISRYFTRISPFDYESDENLILDEDFLLMKYECFLSALSSSIFSLIRLPISLVLLYTFVMLVRVVKQQNIVQMTYRQ